jgi:hypothetical protein
MALDRKLDSLRSGGLGMPGDDQVPATLSGQATLSGRATLASRPSIIGKRASFATIVTVGGQVHTNLSEKNWRSDLTHCPVTHYIPGTWIRSIDSDHGTLGSQATRGACLGTWLGTHINAESSAL